MATTTATRTDHAVSVETAAQILAVKPSTVRRYLCAGKITHLDGGVSADSIDTYIRSRAENIARTRFRPAKKDDLSQLSDVELAAEAWAEAARLEALARDLKAQARPILDAAGPGRHGRFEVRFTAGRAVLDTTAVRADYTARGEMPPMRQTAPAIKVARVA